jgi:hypothetical protein
MGSILSRLVLSDVRKRGLISISAEGQSVLQNVCGDGLAGLVIPSQGSLKQKLCRGDSMESRTIIASPQRAAI